MKILVLTDSSRHGTTNSFYPLVNALSHSTQVQSVHIANRADVRNQQFYSGHFDHPIYVFELMGAVFQESFKDIYYSNSIQNFLDFYDWILLRLPRPVEDSFLIGLKNVVAPRKIINDPLGILETANKKYLLQLNRWTPDISFCENIDDILAFYNRFPIVLKPLVEYGGRGIVKLEDGKAFLGDQMMDLDSWVDRFDRTPTPYLAMRYLKRVKEGDKRIVVAGKTIMGANLRLPKGNSWLCNVAQGGVSIKDLITTTEQEMIEDIAPKLNQKGVFLFGLDTLTDDDGSRVLSEINTLSVGGILSMSQLSGRAIADEVVSEMLHFVHLDFQ